MKWQACILFLLIICSSCSSFDRMHYRHLRKVPADPELFSAPLPDEHSSVCSGTTYCNLTDSSTIRNSDSAFVRTEANKTPESYLVKNTSVCDTVVLKQDHVPAGIGPGAPMRRDWSVVIALLMIIAGILLLLYCIFVVPYFNILLLLILAFEFLFAIMGIKLIVTGFSIIRNRFRQPQTFKEAGKG